MQYRKNGQWTRRKTVGIAACLLFLLLAVVAMALQPAAPGPEQTSHDPGAKAKYAAGVHGINQDTWVVRAHKLESHVTRHEKARRPAAVATAVEVRDTNNGLVGTYPVGENDQCVFPDLEPGTYHFKTVTPCGYEVTELPAPEGYRAPEMPAPSGWTARVPGMAPRRPVAV